MFSKVLIISLTMFINYTLISEGLYDVYSRAPGAHVFAVGTNGLTLKSTNGGGLYSSMNVGSVNLYSVYGINNNLWSVGESGAFNFSTDNGVSWSVQNVGSNATLKSIYFIDSLTGFIAGANGLILKSIDGGNNWISISLGTGNNLNKIKFINQSTGFVCGENGTIIKTTNAGSTWATLSLPVSNEIFSFDVFNNTIIVGTENALLLRSIDLGQTWNAINLKIYSNPGVNSVSLESDNSFYIALESGSILHSTNGGTSFSYTLSPYLNEVNSIYFINSRAYAVGKNSNVVLRLVNGFWTLPPNTAYSFSFEQILPSNGISYNKIFDINYQKRGTVYACQQNKLMRSMDLGENWTQISTLPNTPTTRCKQLLVSMKDSSKMLVALNAPLIKVFRTINYGLNWDSVYYGNTDIIGNMMAQDPSHPDTVYLGVGDSVMRSTNFGLTWLKIADYPFLDWCDIAVHPANSKTLYASIHHYPAKINKSTDGGYNWFTIDFVFDTSFSEMPAIATSNLNPNLIFHVQLGNFFQTGLKRSYSQGNSWLFNIFAGASWSVDIAKDDPNLYANGSVGVSPIYLSTNGGINFIVTDNQWAEQIFFYDRSNLFATTGSAIYKMAVTYNMPIIGIQQISTKVPERFSLFQNYPNPFNPVTNIKFDLAKSSFVKLVVYDVIGREISVLVNEELNAGTYKTDWDASNYPSGVYFYKIETKDFSETRKMILIK